MNHPWKNILNKITASIGRIVPIAKKEFIQFTRDRRSLLVFTFVPMFMLILFGYALNLDVKHVPTIIWDQSNSSLSREFIQSITDNEYFDIVKKVNSYNDIEYLINNGSAKVAFILPDDFDKKILKHENVQCQVILDGSESNTASSIIGYINYYTNNYNLKKVKEEFPGDLPFASVELVPRVWYNPELKTANFFVPGLIAFILMIMAVIATALSMVREKERNTVEQIIVSPIRMYELIIGKLSAPSLIALIAAVLVLLTGWVLFGVSVKGNLILLLIYTIVFLFTALGVGILVSVVSSSQQVAFFISVIVTLLPTLVFSGFIFPLKSMPLILQYISNIISAKYYLTALRGIILKGVGFYYLWEQMVYLLIFLVVIFIVSVIILKKRGLS
ncbi:MAG: ABC transporter permease [Bacteroidetes bacterium]|nr:ABC transporter permease [Bacteroidota bacterium]MBU2584207.1 ABC transporter permease [Bacteroidota bacterium]